MTEHYYHEKTDIPLKLGFVSAWIRGRELEFYTSAPVFSWRKIDKGTLTLAEYMDVPAEAKTFLDLGCGYGVIGITAALNFSELKVMMSDQSSRAVLLSKKNVKKHALTKQIKVVRGNTYDPLVQREPQTGRALIDPATGKEKMKTFDVIASNPPYSAGKDVVNQIIGRAPDFLNPGGVFQIVGRHSKGGKMYETEMLKHFKTVEYSGKQSGYRVYVGRE